MSEIIIGRNAVLEALKSDREIEKLIVAKGAEGSIRKMDGVLVIKVSEEYHLDADWKNKMMSGEYD